jgi:hypothetical protein
LLIFLSFLAGLFRRALNLARAAPDAWVRGIGVGMSAAVLALGVHNVVDSTFEAGTTGYTFWTLAAMAGLLQRLAPDATAAPAAAPRPPTGRPSRSRHAR